MILPDFLNMANDTKNNTKCPEELRTLIELISNLNKRVQEVSKLKEKSLKLSDNKMDTHTLKPSKIPILVRTTRKPIYTPNSIKKLFNSNQLNKSSLTCTDRKQLRCIHQANGHGIKSKISSGKYPTTSTAASIKYSGSEQELSTVSCKTRKGTERSKIDTNCSLQTFKSKNFIPRKQTNSGGSPEQNFLSNKKRYSINNYIKCKTQNDQVKPHRMYPSHQSYNVDNSTHKQIEKFKPIEARSLKKPSINNKLANKTASCAQKPFKIPEPIRPKLADKMHKARLTTQPTYTSIPIAKSPFVTTKEKHHPLPADSNHATESKSSSFVGSTPSSASQDNYSIQSPKIEFKIYRVVFDSCGWTLKQIF